MKIAIMGTGGLGGYFGMRLAQAGHEVLFIARGAQLEALRKRGLRLTSPQLGELALPPVEATDDPAGREPVELVLVCVKAYDLEDAARAIAPLVGADTVVIPLLNGVDMAERIGAAVGMAPMMGGVTYVSANIAAPGVIAHMSGDRLIIGELEGGESPRGRKLEAVFREAGVAVQLSGAIRTELWNKFIVMGGFSVVSCAARVSGRLMVDDPGLRELCVESMREVEAVAAALGIATDPDTKERILELLKTWPPEVKNSMLVDLERGRRLELEWLHGPLLELAAQNGVPMPVIRTLYTVVKPHAGGRPPAA